VGRSGYLNGHYIVGYGEHVIDSRLELEADRAIVDVEEGAFLFGVGCANFFMVLNDG